MPITDDLRARVRAQAGDRCGYCLSHQKYLYSSLEIDHITPQSSGGTDDISTLWLACRTCNSFKGAQINASDQETGTIVSLFNPRTQNWSEHFLWSDDGTFVIGVTPIGRATVIALRLNDPLSVATRREWVSVGWHPPK